MKRAEKSLALMVAILLLAIQPAYAGWTDAFKSKTWWGKKIGGAAGWVKRNKTTISLGLIKSPKKGYETRRYQAPSTASHMDSGTSTTQRLEQSEVTRDRGMTRNQQSRMNVQNQNKREIKANQGITRPMTQRYAPRRYISRIFGGR